VTIELTAAARRYLADIGYDRDYGARPLARIVQDKIKRRLGDELLFGKLADGGTVRLDVDEEATKKVADAKAGEDLPSPLVFLFESAPPKPPKSEDKAKSGDKAKSELN